MISCTCWLLINGLLALSLSFAYADSASNMVDITATSDANYSRSDLYTFESDTAKCEHLEKLHQVTNDMSLNPSCSVKMLEMTFSSNEVLPHGKNAHPYVLLNITAKVRVPVTRLILRLECLEAPNYEDDYCHNHTEQHRRWSRMIWPCRALTVNKPGHINIPFHFTYPYFRIFGYSHYRLNISLMPMHCRSSYIVTIPEETWLYPSIAQFYDPHIIISSSTWSPLAYVDLTAEDGIIIGYEMGTNLHVKRMNLTLFERSNSSIRFLFTAVLQSPITTHKWRDVFAGNYTAYLYVDRADCSLFCDNSAAETCIICPNTRIRFTVDRDKITSRYRHFSHYMAAAACVFVILLFCATSILMFRYSSRRRKRVTTRSIYLTDYPSVFLVYTDDCSPHSACVLALAHCLQKHAGVTVHLDQLDLIASDAVPISWFTETMAAADRVLLVFSEGAHAVLQGKHLVPQNPYPEFFSTAVNYLLSEYDLEVKKNVFVPSLKQNTRFAFVRLCYSPDSVIPANLKNFSVMTFVLPNKFGELVAWLHCQPPKSEVLNDFDFSELESCINEVLAYRADNPAWLVERLQIREQDEKSLPSKEILLEKPRGLLSHKEQIVAAQEFNLELPDSTSSESGGSDDETKYALIGSPEDFSDSNESIDGKLRMRELLSLSKRSKDHE